MGHRQCSDLNVIHCDKTRAIKPLTRKEKEFQILQSYNMLKGRIACVGSVYVWRDVLL